jgi:hypothetical protein
MPTTLDPGNYRATTIALSGGNLVATGIGFGEGTAVAQRPITGLTYFEAVLTTLAATTPGIGLAVSALDAPTFSDAIGKTFSGIAYRPSGVVVINNATVATLAAYVQGDRIDVAVDPFLRLIWFRVNGGNWNNNVANNPVTGVGGIDLTTVRGSTLWPAVASSAAGAVWTTKFSAAFTGVPPAGFASVDTMQITAANATTDGRIPPLVAQTQGPAVRAQSHPADPISRSFTPPGATTTVSGILKELGVAVAGRRVMAFHRATNEYLGQAITAGDGSWSIDCMNRDKVYVIAIDSPYNALAFDNVTPG